MALIDILRAGVEIANNATNSVQQAVTHEAWTGQDSNGVPTFGTAVTRHAIVEVVRKLKPTASGQLVPVVATLTFVEPVSSNGTSGRQEPIDPRDRITLANGFTAPIVGAPDSVMDPGTGKPLINVVYLGENPI